MPTRLLALFSLGAATFGCAPAADPLENAAAEASGSVLPGEPESLVTSLSEIEGLWDIESFADYRPARLGEDGLRRAYVDIGARGLSYTMECNYSGNAAAIDGQGVLRDTSEEPRLSTAMSCGPEIDARDRSFFGFFSSRPRVTRLPDGRLRMASGQAELILQRPAERRLAFVPPLSEIAGRWVPQMTSRVEGGGPSGWGFQDETVLTVTDDRLSWSGCGGLTIRFRYTREGRIEKLEEQGRPSCTDNPGSILVQVLRAGPLVERTARGGLALTAGELVVGLKSLEEVRRLRDNPPAPPTGSEPQPPPPPPPPPGT